jgi:hypothetical protein
MHKKGKSVKSHQKIVKTTNVVDFNVIKKETSEVIGQLDKQLVDYEGVIDEYSKRNE